MRPVRDRIPGLLLVCSVLAAVACAPGAESPAPETPAERPNIVLILADDLGWTDLSGYGSDLYQSPNIDRLAAQGMRFTNSYAAASICSPTRASIMTGKYPARLQLTNYIAGDKVGKLRPPEWQKSLPLEELTIAEALQASGYATGHFGKWHLNKDKNYEPGRPGDPGSQGFGTVLTTVKPESDDDPEGDPHHVREITDAALAFIEAHREGPFFAYVSHNSVHRPVIGRSELVEKYAGQVEPDAHHDNPLYAAMVQDLDESVARILTRLDELGLAENTLVIFTSDNGGFLGDEKDAATINLPLRAGKGHSYEGGIRVPTIVRWPGVTRAGTQSDEPISTVDFFPTLLSAAKTPDDPAHAAVADGVSIVPLLEDPSATLGREALFWHYPHYSPQEGVPSGAVRVGDLKLIEFFEDMHVELYDLAQDIGEQHDLSEEMPEKAAELRDRLHAWREAVGAQMPTPVS
jgi:arylsulfatase A-like enzyme